MDVIAVGGDDVVIFADRCDPADRDGFLPYVEVTEAADLADLVHFGTTLFESAAEDHPSEHLDQRVAIEM